MSHSPHLLTCWGGAPSDSRATDPKRNCAHHHMPTNSYLALKTPWAATTASRQRSQSLPSQRNKHTAFISLGIRDCGNCGWRGLLSLIPATSDPGQA